MLSLLYLEGPSFVQFSISTGAGNTVGTCRGVLFVLDVIKVWYYRIVEKRFS
jgi:hypothetical protein